jgi:hypothetical protein
MKSVTMLVIPIQMSFLKALAVTVNATMDQEVTQKRSFNLASVANEK